MDAEELRRILMRPEGLKLDFKQQLYHIDHVQSSVQLREWGEFIKDVLSLANGNIGTAGQTGYLIIGAADRLSADGTRALFDIDGSQITTKRLLEKVNSFCEPPFADLTVKTVRIEGKRIVVVRIPPSPYLHETTQRIDTKKTSYSEHTIFVRRSEHIKIASARERQEIADEKSRWAEKRVFQDSSRRGHATPPHVSRHQSPVDSYLRNIVQREEVLDQRYIELSGVTQRIRSDKTEFPKGLIPNSFRFIDLHQNPQLDDPQPLDAIEDALTIHSRFVLLGAPGSGKTLTLRKLLLDASRRSLAQAHEPIPILINLAQWPDGFDDVPALIAHECHLRGLPELHFSELLILFDALNEMPAAVYPARVRGIDEWLQANDSAQVIISSRERDYREREKLSISTVQIYPLDENRAKRLLYAYLGANDAENLIHQLRPDDPARRSSRDLIHLAQNPYLLMMMAYVYRNFSSLPSSRGQLFQLFVKTLYSREDEHHATEGISYDEMIHGLGNLAFAMHRRRSATAVPTSWASKQVPDALPINNLWTLGLRASLLEFSEDDSILQFAHQLLLEYFAAEGLVKKPAWLRNLKRPSFTNGKRRVSEWDEVVYTLVGITEPNQALVEISVIDPFLAVDCLVHVPASIEITDATKASILKNLTSFFESDSPVARSSAITKIASMSEAAVPHLLAMLESGSPISKRAIVQVLAKINSPSAAKGIISALNDKKKWVRRDAFELVEDLIPADDIMAGDAVIDLFVENRAASSKELLRAFSYFCSLDNFSALQRIVDLIGDSQQGSSIAETLARAGDSIVFQSVFRTLFLALQVFKGDAFTRTHSALLRLADAFVSEQGVQAFRSSRNQTESEWISGLLPLAAAFREEQAHDVAIDLVVSMTKSLALDSLRVEIDTGDPTFVDDFIRDSAQSKPLAPPRVVEPSTMIVRPLPPFKSRPLIALLNSVSVSEGAAAVRKLAELGEAAVEPLITALSSISPRVRRRAPRALAKIRDQRAIQPLRFLLSDRDLRVRKHAVKALAEFHETSLAQDFLELLKDPSSEIRFHALRGIGKVGDEGLTSAIIPCLADRSIDVVLEAAHVLLSWGYETAAFRLSEILLDPNANQNHRVRASRLLGREGGAAALNSLLTVLSHDNSELVVQVLLALGDLRNNGSIESVATMLSNPDVTIRRTAASVLSRFADERITAPLSRALRDDDYIVRVSAVDGLGKSRDKQSFGPLMNALLDEDSVLRSHAAEALGRLGDSRAIEPLTSVLADPNEEVLTSVLEALGQLRADSAAARVAGCFSHPNPMIRLSTIGALSMIGGPESVEVCLKALGDENKMIRVQAINMLGNLKIKEGVKPLIGVLGSEDSEARNMAAIALGRIGDSGAIEPLSRLIEDESPEVRTSARYAMNQLASLLGQPETPTNDDNESD